MAFPLWVSTPEWGSIARRRAQIGVLGAEAHSSALSTQNVEMGPYPKRVSPTQKLPSTRTPVEVTPTLIVRFVLAFLSDPEPATVR